MARPRLVVHSVVVASSANRQTSVTNLLGVDFDRFVPADTEFPALWNQLDVFVRFFTWNCLPETIAIEVWQLDPDWEDVRRVHRYVREVAFRPTEQVKDHLFRVPNVAIPAEGRYAVRVCRLARGRVRGVYWKGLRDDYFHVRRRT